VRLVRLALAALVCVGAVAFIGTLAVTTASAAVSGRHGIAVVGVTAAFGVAFIVSAVRIGRSFLRGYRERASSRRLT